MNLKKHDAVHAAHLEAREVLPWLANGTLDGTERDRVQAHVHACPDCRTELALLHTLRAAGETGAPDCDPERALARLLPQLDAVAATPTPPEPPSMPAADATVSDPAPYPGLDPAPVPALDPAFDPAPAHLQRAQPVAPSWRQRLAANDGSWLRVLAVAQCCAIAVLAGLLVRPGADNAAPAVANTASAPDSGTYRLLGAGAGAQATLVVAFRPDTLERDLRRIVLASGAHIVGGPTVTGAWMLGTEQAPAAVAARLHAEPAVTLAEPLTAQAPP